jgi:hypothetical protein
MTDDELVADYLRRLRRAARSLPRERRRELIAEISGHIAEAQAAGAASGEGQSAALLNALERLGEPGDIVAAARGPRVAARPGGLEIAAVAVLLLAGTAGLVAGIPGIVVGWGTGVVLLWVSPRWRWPDKLLGTLVWPGGLAAPLLLLSMPARASACVGSSHTATRCTGGSGLPPLLSVFLIIVAFGAPILVGIRLLLRARRDHEPGEPLTSAVITTF